MAFERLSEQLAVVATIDPGARTATGTAATDVIDMENHHEAMFIVMFNTLGATDTVDFDVQEGTGTTAGTFNTATAIASITQAVNADDDEQRVITVRGEDMTDGYTYLRGVLTHGGTAATCEVAVIALADRARYKPASGGDLASGTEIVNA